MTESTFQLVQLFGTNSLFAIVGIKSIEYYQNHSEDISLLKQAYLRQVLRNHPSSSDKDSFTLEGVKDAVIRSKKLFVMQDIFRFLTDNTDFEVKQLRKEYLSKGTVPDLPSLQYLKDNKFMGDERDYKVPEFEAVAAELKVLYQQQMKKIRQMQETYVEESTAKN